jgi:AAA+ superfamily predicted ATPase
MIDPAQLFEPTEDFPHPRAQERYAQLLGLDSIKELLHKEAKLLLAPSLLSDWSRKHHSTEIAALSHFVGRPPLFVFAGDVGTGKTQLAETFGDPLARETELTIRLRKMSLNARGSGRVGEMTLLISSAFADVEQEARRMSGSGRRRTGAVILLIDEADALAQSRDLEQMHHEDRAGVNALIRGVDRIARESLPALVVACTNRLDAIDPALRRRAAQTFGFVRPTTEQRVAVLAAALAGLNLTTQQLRQLAEATGPDQQRSYGATYSDLTQRLVPAAVLDAFPNRPLTFERLLEMAKTLEPTAPFGMATS